MKLIQLLKPHLIALFCLVTGIVHAAAIYPIDQANILAGSKFDIKVEFNSVVNQNDVILELNGKPINTLVTVKPEFIALERSKMSFFLLVMV